jgi:nitric oxide reductase NorQ protein
MKDLKQSTKQRFAALDFDYPAEDLETEIVAKESGCDAEAAAKLVQIAHRSRNLKGHGLDEGISTRLLVYAGQMISEGIEPGAACQMTLVTPLTDDPDMRETLEAAVATFFVS